MDQKVTSVRAAARSLGVGKTMLYQLINSGQLRTVRIGRRRLVLITSIEQLLNNITAAEAS